MTEKLLQFIWQFQHFNKSQLQTTDGEELMLINPGQLNKNQGPDFLNARVKIGDTVLVGSIELHIKTTDWHKHQHDKDSNYKNVILHVVYKNDEANSKLPVLELTNRISKITMDRFEVLMRKASYIACESSLSQVKEITWISWKERLLAERLSRKSQQISEFLQQNKHNWEESFWWLIARNFGGKVNGDAFQDVAQSIPLTILTKHKANIHHLEALLLGQAGILHGSLSDSYGQMLYKEYSFFSNKYKFQPVMKPVHLLRMRPGNFPAIRLAQLAMLVHNSSHLLLDILETDNLDNVKCSLEVTANDFWHYRYRFDEPSDYKPKRIGEDMINNILINSVIPVLFCYGSYHRKEAYKTKALTWLEHIRAEKNSITNQFARLTVSNLSAFDSQALIELKNQYCNLKRCLECTIGNSLLRQEEPVT